MRSQQAHAASSLRGVLNLVVIHHNPACGTSRNVLAMIREAGIEPVVVEYLKTGWTRPQLLALLAVANLGPKDIWRKGQAEGEALGDAPSDEALLAAMVAEPILVNRPIVCSQKGVRLCRPKERVLDLLA